MPIYEYACSDCGTKFDAMRSMKDADNVTVCVKCQSTHTRRLPSLCYSQSQGKSSSVSSNCCSGCSGGSCNTCGR